MTPAEAAKLLDLPAGSAPEQIEARFTDLRNKLEDRIAKAPTPGLREKYRASLEQVTAAFETLTLAAEVSDLPSLRRTSVAAPSGQTTSAAAAPTAPVPTAAPPVAAPATADPSSATVALMHLTGCIKSGFTFLLVGIFALVGAAFLNAYKISEGIQQLVAALLLLGAIPLSVLTWRRSVRRARRRHAEGKSNKAEHVLAVVLTSLAALAIAAAAFAYFSYEQHNRAIEAETRASTLKALRDEIPEIEKRLADYEKTVAASEAKQRELERALTNLRQSDPAEIRKARLVARAHGVYVRYLRNAMAHHPGPVALRGRISKIRDVLANPPAETEKLTAVQLTSYEVMSPEDEFARLLKNEYLLPKPELYSDIEERRQAAEQGDLLSMWILYNAYQTGPAYGVDFDPEARIRWVRRAAELGYADAMVALGNEYANAQPELKSGSFTERVTVLPKDPALALSWYRKGAEAGSVWGMAILGHTLLEGRNTPKDSAAGFRWVKRAVENSTDYGYAMRLLGNCYANGDGVAADEKLAIEWWTKAAKLGDGAAKDALQKRNLTW